MRYLTRNIFFALLLVVLFASLSSAAERRLGAVAGANAQASARDQALNQYGAGATGSGPGADLRAISSPKKPQTLTGFPAGTLPGDSTGGGSSGGVVTRMVMSGEEPLPPVIGYEMVGSKLDMICTIAAHVGYTVVGRGYSPTVMDTPYTFALMNGNRKISTLHFNRSMTLVMVQ
jgi:hypothetical protein